MSKLIELYQNCKQSPWLDNIRRSWLKDGSLSDLIGSGIRGVTSNPTIFTNAIESSDLYNDQFLTLTNKGMSVEQAYWELVKTDINDALEILEPVFQESNGKDGFVSIEVSPELAYNTEATLKMAKDLHDEIDKENLLVKIPATKEGLLAIEEMIYLGKSVNVTLIFSIERYQEVIDAYLKGLERRVQSGITDLSNVNSVASFFVSRLDTLVDKTLENNSDKKAADLLGKTAVSQAKIAYQLFKSNFNADRYVKLTKYNANVQRPLWASTSTKNPNYDDLLYVNSLIGPDTVNTMPDSTVEAFLSHGIPESTVESNLEEAKANLNSLDTLGIDMHQVTQELEDQGVESFKKSFLELLDVLDKKLKN